MALDRINDTSEGGRLAQPNVRVHIERIVLEGIDVAPHQQLQLQAAIESELVRLLAKYGIGMQLRTGGAVAKLAGASIQLTGEGPTQFGMQIAQAVYRGISR